MLPCLSSPKYLLTAEAVKQLLHYCPETGVFTWLVTRGRGIAGAVAGKIRKSGYRRITIEGYSYGSGQLAWIYMRGVWPDKTVDHKNRIKSDDRWDNFRLAEPFEQNINRTKPKNNTSGVVGVKRARNKWYAAIRRRGVGVRLGLFDKFEDAVAARRAAEVSDGEWSPGT